MQFLKVATHCLEIKAIWFSVMLIKISGEDTKVTRTPPPPPHTHTHIMYIHVSIVVEFDNEKGSSEETGVINVHVIQSSSNQSDNHSH